MQANRKFRAVPRRHALTVAVGLGLASGAVHADDFEVTSADDSGPGSLRQAILDANALDGPHSITFASDLVGETISLASDLPTIEEDLSLQGSEVTLSGAGEHACLRFNSVDLEIDGLTIQECYSSYGAAIYGAGGSLTITNATLTNNSATYDGGAIEMFNGDSLWIEDSVISNNSSEEGGGGVAVTDVFSTTIIGSTISENSASNDGGGVSVKYGYEVSIVNSTISGNNAGGDGGGLFVETFAGASLDGVTVDDNTAERDGGGIASFGGLHLHSGTRVENNTAGMAGGLLNYNFDGGLMRGDGQRESTGTKFILEDSVIGGNTATSFGGGLVQLSVGEEEPRPVSTRQADSQFEIRNTQISGNSADFAAGGFLYAVNTNGHVSDTLISDNTATGPVGGLMAAAFESRFDLVASTISNNQSDEFAGGMFLASKYSSEAVISNSTISGNTAPVGGGIAVGLNQDSLAGLLGTTITANAATYSYGGGVLTNFQDPNTLFIANSIIAGNTAEVDSPDLSAGGLVGDESMDRRLDAAVSSLMERIRANERTPDGFGQRLARREDRGERDPDNTTFEVSYSLIGSEPDSGNFQPDAATSDVLGLDPELGALGDNGGPTPTHLPALLSPVVNLVALGESGCDDGFDIDQRGFPRPGSESEGCDAGSVELQEIPEAGIRLTPDLDFGDVLVGSAAGPLEVVLSSEGNITLTVDDIAGVDAPFALDFSDCAASLPFQLNPGESCNLAVTFSPDGVGSFAQTVTVASNAQDGDDSFVLSGQGVEGDLVLSPTSGAFGDIEVGDTGEFELTVGNDGDGDLQIDDIVGPNAPFSLIGGDCADVPFVLEPGQSCTLVFGFSPNEEGDFQGSAEFIVAGTAEPFGFPLSGTGVQAVEPVPVPTLNRIGLIIGGGLLALMGLFGLRRRRV